MLHADISQIIVYPKTTSSACSLIFCAKRRTHT
nr:MAG TPA: hypothetical protein [Caudoviricetes sp.]